MQIRVRKVEAMMVSSGHEIGRRDRSVLFCHANGLCNDVWEPVVDAVIGRAASVVAIDLPGHGASTAPLPIPLTDWKPFGGAVLQAAQPLRPLIGVGHSLGATSLLLAELADPGMCAPYQPDS